MSSKSQKEEYGDCFLGLFIHTLYKVIWNSKPYTSTSNCLFVEHIPTPKSHHHFLPVHGVRPYILLVCCYISETISIYIEGYKQSKNITLPHNPVTIWISYLWERNHKINETHIIKLKNWVCFGGIWVLGGLFLRHKCRSHWNKRHKRYLWPFFQPEMYWSCLQN